MHELTQQQREDLGLLHLRMELGLCTEDEVLETINEILRTVSA